VGGDRCVVAVHLHQRFEQSRDGGVVLDDQDQRTVAHPPPRRLTTYPATALIWVVEKSFRKRGMPASGLPFAILGSSSAAVSAPSDPDTSEGPRSPRPSRPWQAAQLTR